MSRLIVLLLLIVLLVLAVNPGARQKAAALVQNLEEKWNNTTVVVTTPAANEADSNKTSTPVPTVTPVATPVANTSDKIIPNTGGDQNENERPIIQVNWDALNAALRKFWDSLRNIKINSNPQENH